MTKRTGSLILGLAILSLAFPAVAFDFFHPVQPPRAFEVMEHRGAKNQAPENTRPAIQHAIEDGFEWVEVDVRLTKDGKHVILHNDSVDNVTDGKGRVQDLTLEEIERLDAGAWFGPEFVGEHLLTLSGCLELARGKINLYLDCKRVNPALLADEVLAAYMESQVVVYDAPDRLAKVKERSKGKVAVMPKWHPKHGLEAWIAQCRPDAVEIDSDEVTPEICVRFHEKGIKVQAKVLNEDDRPEVWDEMLAAGVDWLQTDRAEEIIAHRFWKSLSSRPVQISCHRGANRYAPENTAPAFEKAVALGVDYVEFDVRTSKDGQYFILHDNKLDRTTSGKGPIAEQDAAAIRLLDAGTWFGRPYQGEKLPSFDDTLRILGGKAALYVDAKDIAPEALARKLLDSKLVDQAVVYDGADYLMALRKINPAIRGLCPLDALADIEPLAETVHPYGFDVAWNILSAELIRKCHDRGIKVFSDAMDGHDQINDYLQAMDWGIDVIQTDFPLRVIRAVEIRANPAK